MTQKLRPAANITQYRYTGGFAEIDEATASDADYAYCNNSGGGTLEVRFSWPAGTPAAGSSTLRYRVNKCRTTTGEPQSAGGDPNCAVYIFQGTTLIAAGTSAAVTTGPAWTTRTDMLDLSAITDWTDVRFRLVSGGNNRPHVGLSWVELEVPGPARSIAAGAGGFTLSGAAAGLVKSTKVLPAAAGTFAITPAAVTLKAAFKLPIGAGALTVAFAPVSLGKGISFLPARGAFALAGAALAFALTERSYLFEGRPKPHGSAPRRLLARSDHKCR